MMKRTIILLALTVCFLCQAKGTWAADKTMPLTARAVQTAPGWQATVVAQEFTGPVAGIEQNLKVFTQEFNRQQLLAAGPPLGIFYQAPRNQEDPIRYELAYPVVISQKAPLQVREPLKNKAINYKKAVASLHVGPYQDLFNFYNNATNSVRAAQFKIRFPVIHRYLDNPSMVSPAELRTEVIIPVKEDLRVAIPKAVKLAAPFATTVVSQEFTGPVTGIEANLREFSAAFFKQGLQPAGPPLGIFYEEPKDQQSPIRYALAFPVAPAGVKAARMEGPLKVLKLNLKKMAKFEHVGPYPDLFNVHREFRASKDLRAVKTNAAAPIIHQFVDNPAVVDQEDLRTEVLIPVQ